MKPVTTILGETGSTPIIGTWVERAFSFIRVKYSLSQSKGWNDLGFHIGLLIMAALQYLAPEFIKEGRLCWLRSPLYIVKNGKNNSYYYTDSEFDKVRKTISGTVTRAKGLGELSDSIAKESMFNEANQRMEVIDWSSDGIALLCNLMGKEVAPRADFIFKNVDFSTITE